MTFIDTHCHLSDGAFAGEEDSYIQRAKEAGVEIMLQPDVDSRERQSMFDVTGRHPGVLFPMLGLYPGSVDKEWEKEIGRMLDYSDKKVVAIGEIGLDYYYG
ncbi:MAG: TatD family hydrolase, partial [Bacteroidales bacterium]|nr:TatD family hydrolase [Bacteroidales bacterium]